MAFYRGLHEHGVGHEHGTVGTGCLIERSHTSNDHEDSRQHPSRCPQRRYMQNWQCSSAPSFPPVRLWGRVMTGVEERKPTKRIWTHSSSKRSVWDLPGLGMYSLEETFTWEMEEKSSNCYWDADRSTYRGTDLHFATGAGPLLSGNEISRRHGLYKWLRSTRPAKRSQRYPK